MMMQKFLKNRTAELIIDLFFFLLVIEIIPATAGISAQTKSKSVEANKHLIFTYFVKNGEDGLHIAVSDDGLKWKVLKNGESFLKPLVGKEKLMRDPAVCYGKDKIFHMVWTAGWREKGIGYAESKDLINWSEQKYIPVMENEPEALNCWAPEILYDEENDQYIIYWATTIPGRFPETDGQNKSATSAGLNHRIYCVTTKDFRSFSGTKLFYDHGFNVIDADIVKDGNRYVMFLKDETNVPFTPQKNIRVSLSDTGAGPYSKPSKPVTGSYWAEGPSAIKIGQKWYLYFDKYREHKYGVITSDDLETWSDLSDKLEMPADARHGLAIYLPDEIYLKLTGNY